MAMKSILNQVYVSSRSRTFRLFLRVHRHHDLAPAVLRSQHGSIPARWTRNEALLLLRHHLVIISSRPRVLEGGSHDRLANPPRETLSPVTSLHLIRSLKNQMYFVDRMKAI